MKVRVPSIATIYDDNLLPMSGALCCYCHHYFSIDYLSREKCWGPRGCLEACPNCGTPNFKMVEVLEAHE